MENNLSLVTIVVNSGYSDQIMSIVKKEGACGGTIIDGIGSARKDAEKLYGVTIQPNKEVILVIVTKTLKNKIMKAIYENAGKDSQANAIAFSIPIEAATSNLTSQYQKTE